MQLEEKPYLLKRCLEKLEASGCDEALAHTTTKKKKKKAKKTIQEEP